LSTPLKSSNLILSPGASFYQAPFRRWKKRTCWICRHPGGPLAGGARNRCSPLRRRPWAQKSLRFHPRKPRRNVSTEVPQPRGGAILLDSGERSKQADETTAP